MRRILDVTWARLPAVLGVLGCGGAAGSARMLPPNAPVSEPSASAVGATPGAAELGASSSLASERSSSIAPGAAKTVAEASEPALPSAAPAQLLRIRRVSQATRAERETYLYLPKGYDAASSERWPVLLFLHGNGERGDAKADLDYLLKNGPLYEAWIQKRDLPFIIIAPQLPMYGMDEKADYLKKRTRAEIPRRLDSGVPERPPEHSTSEAMTGALAEPLPKGSTPYGPPKGWPELEADLLALLDEVLANYHGDPSRQYLSGVSYGGFGTWYMAGRHAQRFAAIVPVVGYGHPDSMPAIAEAKLPVWCFAGGRDAAVRAKYFYAGLNRLEQLGHEFRFTIEADMGHDVWTRVYAGNDVYDWMLAHRKVAGSARAVTP
jgi:pimeloyl-ACP methyl ester carboxylesterase